MSEKLAKNIENLQGNAELEATANERRSELAETLEKAAEQESRGAENLETAARTEALELAKTNEKEQLQPTTERMETKRASKPTKLELKTNLDRTMTHIRKDMSPASRTFSKVIHNPIVEKTSDVVGNTVARPNLILAGALGTLILCSIVYLTARKYGYVLSGFEAIGTFLLGWGIGAIIEFARVGLKNNRNS